MTTEPPDKPKPPLRVVRPGDPSDRKRGYSRGDRTKLLGVVEQLMLDGQRRDQIVSVLQQAETAGQLPHVSKAKLSQAMRTVEQLWSDDARAARATNRQKAINRCLRHMRDARKDKKWHAVKGFEELIAKLQGLAAPEHVQISFAQGENLARIIGDLNDDEISRMAADRERDMIEAERYRLAIDAPGEPLPRDGGTPRLPPGESSTG